jgi:hypothetical protein
MKKLILVFAIAVALVIVSLFVMMPRAHGTTRFIARSAGTFHGGRACKGHTTITPETFNSTTSAPGDVNYICGTITVPVNTEALVVNGSGTGSNPIRIDFDSGAVLVSPEWPAHGSGGAIDTRGNSHIVINGNGGVGGATQGVIEATSNGDAGAACLSGPCQYHGDSNAIEADGSTNLTVEGLAIIDMYVATNPTKGGGTCIYDHGPITDWTISNNLMHDMGWCISLQYDNGTSSGITISNNQIYNIDHGIALGGPHPGNTLMNVKIYGNNIHDYSNWDTAADIWHHDGVHIWGYHDDGSDRITGVSIYNNQFGGCVGKNVTAHIFVEWNSGSTTEVRIYNNLLIDTCPGNDNDGLINIDDPGDVIYNNTFMGAPTDTCMGVSNAKNLTFINNVVTGCRTLIWVDKGGSFSPGGLHNNVYANCSGSNCFAYRGNYSGWFSIWKSATGQDASRSVFVSNAKLSPAGVPDSSSAVIGAGENLTLLGIRTLDSDIVGNLRPTTGAWTAGAHSNSSSAPAPRIGPTGTVQ